MYRKTTKSWMKHWDFEIFDILCLEIAFFTSYAYRHKGILPENYLLNQLYIKMAVLLVLIDIVVVFFTRNYNNVLQRSTPKELLSVIKHISTVVALLLVYEFIVKEADVFSRTVFILTWGLGIVLCFVERALWKQVIRKRISKDSNQSKMLLITTGEHVNGCLNQLYNKKFREFDICAIAVMEEKISVDVQTKLPILKGHESLISYIRSNVVDEVYIDTLIEKKGLENIVNMFLGMGVTVHIGMGFLPEDLPNQFIEKIGDARVITTTIKVASGWQIAIKRIMDILGGLVGLLFMGIAFIFVAPIIKKQSPGPIFFKQERVGKNGRSFYMYKFRSMYMDAEERKKDLMSQNEMNGLMFKMENDPRIIGSEKGPGKGIGNFIRKTSIDELPQFWNILKGDMSMVGTRPPTKNEYEQYDLHHKIRLSMKPGLTGIWQTSGRSEITDFDEVVRLDTKYIEEWSLGLDIKLLFKTFKVVFKKEGSK